jgi:hypothetical protein
MLVLSVSSLLVERMVERTELLLIFLPKRQFELKLKSIQANWLNATFFILV